MIEHRYVYDARVVNVVDADTLDLDIDLGCNVTVRERVRLHRVNAWETRGEEREKGLAAKAYVEVLVHRHPDVLVRTHKDKRGKYGRYLAELYIGDVNINDALVEAGHARYQSY